MDNAGVGACGSQQAVNSPRLGMSGPSGAGNDGTAFGCSEHFDKFDDSNKFDAFEDFVNPGNPGRFDSCDYL